MAPWHGLCWRCLTLSIRKVLIQIRSLVFDPYWKCVPILSQKKTQRLLHCISTIPKDFRVGKKTFLEVFLWFDQTSKFSNLGDFVAVLPSNLPKCA